MQAGRAENELISIMIMLQGEQALTKKNETIIQRLHISMENKPEKLCN